MRFIDTPGRIVLHTCVTKAPGATLCVVKDIDLAPLYLLVTGNYHLCNTLAVSNGKSLIGKVYEYNTHLATIVGKGCNSIGESILALKSIPAERSVAYEGN